MDFDAMKDVVQRAQGDTMTHDHHQPSGVSVDLPEIIDWLSSKRSTLWSTWAIDDDKGKEQAARWFYKELVSLMNHTASKMHQPTGG